MTSGSSAINSDCIDGKVIELLRKMPGLSTQSIYYQLGHIPQTLVFASIKRLQKSEMIGFCLIDEKTFPLGESKSTDDIPPGGIKSEDPQHSPWGNLRVKACKPGGTAKTDNEYYSIYLDNVEIAYLGGGNTQSALAQKRKAEFEQLVEKRVIHPDLPIEEIKRLVKGIQCRNMNV
ncbi:MAG: hypothetical protein VKK42_03405 [Lyngbya sp.]|nr:hypothetical protein [Lyngbya sp.]